MKKRLMAMDSELWTVTEIGVTDLCKMAEADDIRKYTRLDIMASEEFVLTEELGIRQCGLPTSKEHDSPEEFDRSNI